MRREVKIGVFAVVMLGCLWGGVRFLSGIDIFSRNIPYYVSYPEISGIQTATPVTIQGVKVGTVTAIEFEPSVNRDVTLQLSVRRKFRIPKDSEARIYTDGLMGGKAIAIEMGHSSEMLRKGDTLQAAETRDMLAAAGTELADVKERLTRVMDNLTVTLENVNAILSDNKTHIDGTLAHLNSISGTMDEVLSQEKGDLRTALDNISRFSTALGENSEHLSSMLGNMDRFSEQLAGGRNHHESGQVERGDVEHQLQGIYPADSAFVYLFLDKVVMEVDDSADRFPYSPLVVFYQFGIEPDSVV